MSIDFLFQRYCARCVLLLTCIGLLSGFTVILQVRALGREYLIGEQMRRHRAILEGTAKAPYQYRLLPEYVLAGLLRLSRAAALPEPVLLACVGLRFTQNFLIFLLAAWYYHASGFRPYWVLLGIAILAWGMSHAYYNSDLAFNTYFDVIFYLAAALLIRYRQEIWLMLLMVFAALNRETCGLIPIMFVTARYSETHRQKGRAWTKLLGIAGGTSAVYAGIFIGLRLTFGSRELSVPEGYSPGMQFIFYNLRRPITWIQLLATFNILPILAVFSWHFWPTSLKKLCWAIVPAWMLIHLCYSVIAETRLLLVPFALILIPGVLHGLNHD